MIEKNGYVIVEKGDTLGAISSKVGMSTNELQKANPAIKDINKIYENQKIKTKPKEKIKEEPKVEESKVSEEKEIEEPKDEPVKNSEATSDCCCIKTWEIHEKDEKGVERSHEKVVDLKKIGQPYILNIVTPDATKDGKVTHKVITSKITKKCDKAVMVVAKGNQLLTIGVDGEITIDTDGVITTKGIIKTQEELENPKEKVWLADYIRALAPLRQEEEEVLLKEISEYLKPKPRYPLADGYIESMPCPNGYRLMGYLDVEAYYNDSMEHTTHGAYQNARSMPLCQDMRKVADSDFKTIIRMLTSSKAENTLEIKSTNKKCHKKVFIGVTPSFSVEGEISITFGVGYVTEQKLQNKRDIIVSPFVKLEGKITVVKGSFSTEYSGAIGSSAETKTVKQGTHNYKPRKKIVKAQEHLMGSAINTVGSFFKLFYEAKKEKELSKKKKKQKKKTWKFSPGSTQFTLKTLPGSQVIENPKGNDLDWQGEIALGVTFFKGAKMEMDIIDYVITRAGALAGFIRDKRAELESHGIKVEAMFELASAVDFSFEWEKKAGETIKVKKSSVSGELALSFQSKIEATYSSGFDYVGTLEFKTTAYSDNAAPTKFIITAAAEVGKDNDIAYSGDIEFTGVGIYVAISLDVVKKKVEASKGANGDAREDGKGVIGDLESEWKQTLIKKDGSLPIIPNVSLMKDILGDKQIAKKKT
jgi:hypothetical protein